MLLRRSDHGGVSHSTSVDILSVPSWSHPLRTPYQLPATQLTRSTSRLSFGAIWYSAWAGAGGREQVIIRGDPVGPKYGRFLGPNFDHIFHYKKVQNTLKLHQYKLMCNSWSSSGSILRDLGLVWEEKWLAKNHFSISYSIFPSQKPKPPGVLLAGKFKLQNMYH